MSEEVLHLSLALNDRVQAYKRFDRRAFHRGQALLESARGRLLQALRPLFRHIFLRRHMSQTANVSERQVHVVDMSRVNRGLWLKIENQYLSDSLVWECGIVFRPYYQSISR